MQTISAAIAKCPTGQLSSITLQAGSSGAPYYYTGAFTIARQFLNITSSDGTASNTVIRPSTAGYLAETT